MLNYLIGINHKTNSKNSNPETKKFSDINKLKHLYISSKNDTDIKNILKDIFINLNNFLKNCKKKRIKLALLAGSSYGVGKTSLIKRIINKFGETRQFIF